MSKKVRVFIVVLVGILLAWGFYSIARLIIIKNKGSQIAATVLKVDTDCDRYNKIEVDYGGKSYSVTISRTDCRDGVYKVGQAVILIKYKDDNTLVWPEAHYEWLPFLFLGILTLAYFTNKIKFGKSKQPTPNRAFVK
jgi:hypothetical protein